jgi:hypothetical protein
MAALDGKTEELLSGVDAQRGPRHMRGFRASRLLVLPVLNLDFGSPYAGGRRWRCCLYRVAGVMEGKE